MSQFKQIREDASVDMKNVSTLGTANALLMANHRLNKLLEKAKPVVTRVLIVADGNVDFRLDNDFFGLNEFITNTLRVMKTPWEHFEIVTAHRNPSKETNAEIVSFTFDASKLPPHNQPLNIDDYAQVWLFGYDPTAELSPGELLALNKFMQDGGGVFATGDHQDLGFGLCGKVARVSKMRRWQKSDTPPRDGELRLDTLRPGENIVFEIDDECDNFPQFIQPRFYKDCCGTATYPHPLLVYGSGAVNILPDHRHEGECVISGNLSEKIDLPDGEQAEEFPSLSSGGQLAPEVVAISVSAGGFHLDGRREQRPVIPRCFGAVSAYDGQRVGVGRVVVDASFHHFTDANLRGIPGDPSRRGFHDNEGKPTREYEVIKQFYRNIVMWLTPPTQRHKRYLALLIALRYTYPLIEELRSGEPTDYENILAVGSLTRRALSSILSPAEIIQCVLSLLEVEEAPSEVAALIDPWLPGDLRPEGSYHFFNSDVITTLVLGSAMIGVANTLPDNLLRAEQSPDLLGKENDVLDSLVASNIKSLIKVLKPLVEQTLPNIHRAFDAFNLE